MHHIVRTWVLFSFPKLWCMSHVFISMLVFHNNIFLIYVWSFIIIATKCFAVEELIHKCLSGSWWSLFSLVKYIARFLPIYFRYIQNQTNLTSLEKSSLKPFSQLIELWAKKNFYYVYSLFLTFSFSLIKWRTIIDCGLRYISSDAFEGNPLLKKL